MLFEGTSPLLYHEVFEKFYNSITFTSSRFNGLIGVKGSDRTEKGPFERFIYCVRRRVLVTLFSGDFEIMKC